MFNYHLLLTKNNCPRLSIWETEGITGHRHCVKEYIHMTTRVTFNHRYGLFPDFCWFHMYIGINLSFSIYFQL